MARKGRGEIVRVADLFEVYKKRLIAPEKIVKDSFFEVIKDIFEFNLPPESVSYNVHAKTLYINTNGQLKTEILLRKQDILDHMKGRLGEKSSPKDLL